MKWWWHRHDWSKWIEVEYEEYARGGRFKVWGQKRSCVSCGFMQVEHL